MYTVPFPFISRGTRACKNEAVLWQMDVVGGVGARFAVRSDEYRAHGAAHPHAGAAAR